MKIKYLLLLSVAAALVTLDQVIKVYVHTKFYHGESIVVIPDFFNLTYVRNPGAAFGFLAKSHPEFRDVFFLLVPPIAMGIILWILRTVEDKDRIQILALSFVFSGALGNYIDRVRLRYVIDFLDFHYKNQYTWPAFNVADMAIVCGISILMILSFTRKPEKA